MRATPHQQRSALLSMHATADKYAESGAQNALKQQLAKITARETTLREESDAAMWARYLTDRDEQRCARQHRHTADELAQQAAQPEETEAMHQATPRQFQQPAPETHESYMRDQNERDRYQQIADRQAKAAEQNYGTENDAPTPREPARPRQPIHTIHQIGTAPTIPPPPEPIRCNFQACRRLATERVTSTEPRCATHTAEAIAEREHAAAIQADKTRKARTRTVRYLDGPPTNPAELTPLDSAVEELVKQYTCGAVIDAAWNASHRLFKPQ